MTDSIDPDDVEQLLENTLESTAAAEFPDPPQDELLDDEDLEEG